MGQPSHSLLKLCSSFLLLWSINCMAQPLSDRSDPFTFNPQGKYQPRVVGLFETDRNSTAGSGELLTPVFQNNRSIFYSDIRAGNSSSAVYLLSAGGGIRHHVHPELLGNAYMFFNYKEDYVRGPEEAVVLGLEFLADGYEARINALFPTSKPRRLEPEPGQTRIRESIPLTDLSGEIGYDLPGIRQFGFNLRLYVGGFYRRANNINDISGAQSRLELSRSNLLGVPGLKTTVVGQIRYNSDINYPIGAFQFRISAPLVKYWKGLEANNFNQLTPVEQRMTERVRRPISIGNVIRQLP